MRVCCDPLVLGSRADLLDPHLIWPLLFPTSAASPRWRFLVSAIEFKIRKAFSAAPMAPQPPGSRLKRPARSTSALTTMAWSSPCLLLCPAQCSQCLMFSDTRKPLWDRDGALRLCNCKKKLSCMPAQSRSPCAAHSHECGSGTGPGSQPFGPAPHFWSMRGALARCRCGKGSPTRPLSWR